VADRLRVYIDEVRGAARTVASLREAVTNAGTQIGDGRAAIGDEHLSSRLGDLLDGWRIHREQICGDLDTFSQWTLKAADSYVATDGALAQSVGGS
jgi:hypothetical protein